MKTLILEIVTVVVFWPLRIVSRIFGRRANARVRHWQDNTWTWWLGAGAAGYIAGSHLAGGEGHQSVGGHDVGHHGGHDAGGHDIGGGFDGGGFGGGIG